MTKTLMREALEERIRMERQAERKAGVSGRRLGEGEAVKLFNGIPSVESIAYRLREQRQAAREEAIMPKLPETQGFLARISRWLSGFFKD